MEGEASLTTIIPSTFDGTNYKMWIVRIETYLEALDLYELVEEDYEVFSLPTNLTTARMKVHNEMKIRKSKAKASLFAAVTPTIFTRIMSLK